MPAALAEQPKVRISYLYGFTSTKLQGIGGADKKEFDDICYAVIAITSNKQANMVDPNRQAVRCLQGSMAR